MRRELVDSAAIDALHAELLRAGEGLGEIRAVLARHAPEETALLALLRRALPVRFLEHVGTAPPWCDRPSVLGRLVQNPRTPRALSLRLLPSLFWRDLAEVAASPQVPAAVRVRAEARLKEMLPDMRLGDRVTLAKVATPAVLRLLLADAERKVAGGCLINARLREEDLLEALRQATVAPALIETVVASPKWKDRYAVRLALALQPRTPLAIALLQISSLVRRDLMRVVDTPGLRPLLRAAALRVLEEAAEGTLKGSAT